MERVESEPTRPEGAAGAPRGGRWVEGGVLLLAVAWVAFVALAVVRVPLGALWLPTVVASSWVHLWLGLGAAFLGIAFVASRRRAPRRSDRVVLCLLTVGVLIPAVPVLRQRLVAHEITARLARFTGSAPLPDSAPATKTLEIERTTHPYVEREDGALLLDLYRPTESSVPPPVVVIIHGGSWQRGDRTEVPSFSERLASRGFAVASIDYRLAPRHRCPAMIEDIEAALSFLAREGATLGVDGSRVVLLGRSAGGHLALTAAYTFPDRVRGVIAYYAPTDLPWSWETSTDTTYIDGRALIEALMGATPAEAPELYRSMSPIHRARADSPPTLLLHGARDRLVSPQQGPRLAARLEELGVPHVHIEIPGATHGFDVAAGGVATRLGAAAVERFLEATLID